jgi:hypothetical protein
VIFFSLLEKATDHLSFHALFPRPWDPNVKATHEYIGERMMTEAVAPFEMSIDRFVSSARRNTIEKSDI